MGIILLAGLVIGLFFIFQWGKVYSKQQTGRAALAEAEFSKQVQLEEAKANLESQKLNAQSEVERAKGAARAIEIEDGKLTEQYIRYLYVQNLEKLDTQLIYVPTEGGLPLLEASRLQGEK
ncbi:hypothetical protein RCF27_09250 [Rhodococcus pyridinivorans]|uniref:hypothetical protein n=1 Tax=Rhodococcus pyridinivorans TaxID=103816 RepID=UPI00280C292D|nr:hypothetical protein [Rhodococcus pyridinivorans]WMM74444.1 hypothetical protein RCF27_09250 [Rhodococcus pyridinivorans]